MRFIAVILGLLCGQIADAQTPSNGVKNQESEADLIWRAAQQSAASRRANTLLPSYADDGAKRQDYTDFQDQVEKIISDGKTVAASDLERSDLHSLEFQLKELNKSVAARDWKNAEEIRARMNIALQRSGAVAADAPRRLAARQRADEERRHREEMQQQERFHDDLMNAIYGGRYLPH